MTNHYKLIPVSVKPEKEGTYHLCSKDGRIVKSAWYCKEDGWLYILKSDNITHYLLPLSEQEHKGIQE